MKNVVKFLGMMFVVLGKSAHAEEPADSLLDMNYLQQYVIQSDDRLIFDVDRAEQNQESTIILEVGQTFNQFAKLDDNTTEGKKRVIRAISIPIYGNYCGPGTDFNSAGNPIDQLDKYCMYHDLCYGAHGWGNKQCDIQLVTNLTTGLRNGTIKGAKAEKAKQKKRATDVIFCQLFAFLSLFWGTWNIETKMLIQRAK